MCVCVCVLWWMCEERARDCCKCYDSDRLELCLLYCGGFYSLHMDIETLKWLFGLEKTLLASKLTNTKASYKRNCSRSDRERKQVTSTERERYREKLIKWHTAILFIISYKTNRKYLQKNHTHFNWFQIDQKHFFFFWSKWCSFYLLDYMRKDAVGEGGRAASLRLGGAGQGGGVPEALFYMVQRWSGERGSLWGREVAGKGRGVLWGDGTVGLERCVHAVNSSLSSLFLRTSWACFSWKHIEK